MEMVRRIVALTNVSIFDRSWLGWGERLETNLSELRVNCCNSPQVLPLPGLQVQLYTFNEIIMRICIVIISLQHHDLNYWNLLCLGSRPCNTPGGNDHQVNRHIHWDEIWADFRPEHYFSNSGSDKVLNGSLSITTLSSWCAWLQCRDQRSTYLVRSIALSNLGFWGDGDDGSTMKSSTYEWKIIEKSKQYYMGSLQAASTILGRTTATGRWPATSRRAASPRASRKKTITTLITACHCYVWAHYSVSTAWVMHNDAPLCKCKSLVGCQSACSSWNWTHLDPSSAEIYWSIKWRVLLKISIHIQKPRICNRLRESISSHNDDVTLLSWSIPSGSPKSLLSTISSGTLSVFG